MPNLSYQVSPILNIGHLAKKQQVPLTFNLQKDPWPEQGFRCAIAGSSGSGKSYALAIFAEELTGLGVPWLVIDPDGEYQSLGQLPGVVYLSADDDSDIKISHSVRWRELVLKLLARGAGVVLNLAELPEPEQRVEYSIIAGQLFDWQRRRKAAGSLRPIFLLIEEAHLFAPEICKRDDPGAREITIQIARRGRKFGLNWIMASQRPGDLIKQVLGQANIKLIGRLEIPHDFDAVKPYLPKNLRLTDLIRLSPGQFYLRVGPDLHLIQTRQRQTEDLGSTPKIEYVQRQLFDLDALKAEVSQPAGLIKVWPL